MVSVVQKMNAATADDGLDNDLKTAKQRRSLTGWRIPDNAGGVLAAVEQDRQQFRVKCRKVMCHLGYLGKADNVAVSAKGAPCIPQAKITPGIFRVDIAQAFTQVALHGTLRDAKLLSKLPDTERFSHKEAADQYGETACQAVIALFLFRHEGCFLRK